MTRWVAVVMAVLAATAEAGRIVSVWDPPSAEEASSSRSGEFQEAAKLAKPLGPFQAARTERAVWLSNGVIEVGLARSGTTVSVASLRDVRRQVELLAGDGPMRPLWSLMLRAQTGKTSEVDAHSAGAASVEIALDKPSGQLATQLAWKPMTPIGVNGTLAVKAEIRLAEGEPFVRWRINVENRLTDAGLWRVDFPVLPNPGHAGKSDVLMQPYLCRAHDGELKGHLFHLQFLSVGSLYLAAHDPAHHHKGFLLRTGQEFRQQALPPDAGVAGASYEQPYDFVTGTSGGDWFDAAQLYRQWAEKQAWWASGRRRRDVAAWLTVGHPLTQEPAAVTKKALELRDALGAPVGIHWYNWYNKPIAPRLFPVKKGFAEAAKAAEAAGVTVMPYVSIHYWTKSWDGELWKEFEQVRPFACRSVEGIEGDEARREDDHYRVQVQKQGCVPICRYTDFWANYLAEQVKRLRAESGCSAVYFDMAATAPRWPCFDRAHGHPAGGGDHWARGNDKLLARLRHTVGQEVLLSGEGRYEGHIPFIDMDLTGYWRGEHNLAPAYDAIYGERRLSFASAVEDEDAAAIVFKLGARWLHGATPRIGPWILEPNHADILQFVRQLAKMRSRAAPFFNEGRLVRPPAWASSPGFIRCERWKLEKRGEPAPMEFPAAERSAWRLADGTTAVLLMNFDAQRRGLSLNIERRTIRHLADPGGNRLEPRVLGSTLQVDIPARDVMVCVLSATTASGPL
ncbi:MAG: hypothetical protein FJ279_09675 [Planctomycetes bacterium]|nr:hypothetical protein [Planctomycetota bacterium]